MPDSHSVTIIGEKLTSDLFDRPLIQNNLRGIWMEYVVAEALGTNFRIVGQDWHAWDIESGDPKSVFPARIRIQVKNTSRTQTWGRRRTALTDCQWTIALRNRPSYFTMYNPEVPCEQYGFLCDVFVLCHHHEEDWAKADHRDLAQWDFYVLPVTTEHTIYPIHEIDSSIRQKKKTFTIVPESLAGGLRKRPCIRPVKFEDLNEMHLLDCLKRWRRPA